MIKRPDNRLAEVMREKSISRRDIAVALDVSEDTVRRLEKPDTAISSKYLPALAPLLGVTTDYLLGLDRQPVGTAEAI